MYIICFADEAAPLQPVQSPGGSSTCSSRDTSPCREISPLVTSLKPPVIIRRGPQGFGFTVHTIRVYYGDSDFYTMHHLIMVSITGNYLCKLAVLYTKLSLVHIIIIFIQRSVTIYIVCLNEFMPIIFDMIPVYV
jgi:hypothetical protein